MITKSYQCKVLVYLTSILVFAVVTLGSAAQVKKKTLTNKPVPAISCTAVPGNLVTNCGFETGDFTGWTQGGDVSFTVVSEAAAHRGAFGAFLGPISHPGLLTQLVTTPFKSCRLSFWLRSNGRPAQFEVWWNGDKLAELHPTPDMAYTQLTYDVPATGSATDLTFAFTNIPSFTALDDIVVVCN